MAHALARRLSGVLPRDVRVTEVALAPHGFDARFAALWRRYAYRVSDHPAGVDPLRRTTSSTTAGPGRGGDGRGRRRAARGARLQRLLPAAGGSHHRADPARAGLVADGDGLVVATVVADAFCHNMVRALVGACLAVGEGRRPAVLAGRGAGRGVRRPDVQVVPPHGLTLEEVRYPRTRSSRPRGRPARAADGSPPA